MQLLTTYSPLMHMRNAMVMGVNAPDIISTGRYAQDRAVQAYPHPSQATREADAYRHLLWQGLLANKYGPEIAQLAGNFHENPLIPFIGGMGQPESQQLMDLYNNMLGRQMEGFSEEEMDKKAKKLIKDKKAKLNAEAGSY